MAPAGFIALLAGWVTTEVGRQPCTVYGVLRTADSVSPIGAPGVGASLAAFVVVYLLVFGAGFSFLLRLIARPPQPGERGPAAGRADPHRRHHAGPGGRLAARPGAAGVARYDPRPAADLGRR